MVQRALAMTVDYTQPIVSLVDQDRDFRSLAMQVLGDRQIQVQVYDSAHQFLEAPMEELTGPRCVLLDLGLEGMSALTIEEELRRRGSRVPIIAASGQDDIPVAIRAIQEGALALLQKPVDAPMLVDQVFAALAIDSKGLQNRRDHAAVKESLKQLSSREYEVMELLVRAKNSKEIGSLLGIGVQTVLKHRAHVLKKLNVRNDVELALLITAYRNDETASLLPPMSFSGGSFA